MTLSPFELPTLEPTPEAAGVGAYGAPSAAARVAQELAAARAQADQMRIDAEAAGFAAGLAEARASLEPLAAALTAALAGVEAERARSAAVVEEAAISLAMAVAEQALSAALAVQPERVVDVVRGALRRLVERERVTVLVHPDDLEAVRTAVPSLLAELGGMEHCEVQAERRLARGGALVRTVEGEVDATLATKLTRAGETIAEALRDSAVGGADEADFTVAGGFPVAADPEPAAFAPPPEPVASSFMEQPEPIASGALPVFPAPGDDDGELVLGDVLA